MIKDFDIPRFQQLFLKYSKNNALFDTIPLISTEMNLNYLYNIWIENGYFRIRGNGLDFYISMDKEKTTKELRELKLKRIIK